MNLKKFPLDSQLCPLYIGSYGYASQDITYHWKAGKPMSFAPLSMAQFKLISWNAGVKTNTTNRKIESGFRKDSVAFVHFYLERQSGFFLLQVK